MTRYSPVDSSGTSSPVADNLGSAVALTDSAGALQTQYTYEPFGKTTTSGPTNGNAQKYTSREDDGTSLYYYRARYYSPTLQRFISEDSIEFEGGPNLYEYVFNNPVNGIDPWGLQKADPGFWSLYGSYAVGDHISSLCSMLGSVIALTDSTGVIQTQYTFEPFGTVTASGAASSNTSQYASRENDGTGLYYYRARFYSPALARFLAEDPIEFEGGDINLYAYVSNSPLVYTDPSGLEVLTARQYEAPVLGGRKSDSEVELCRFLGIVGTFAAGFADHIDFGLSDTVRDWTGANSAVDKNHPAYDTGTAAGYAWDVGMAVAAPARAAGYSVEFNYYRKAKGVGMTVLKKGERCLGIDWHRFKMKSTGQMVNRPHGHWGPTRTQVKKHRSLFTGKPM